VLISVNFYLIIRSDTYRITEVLKVKTDIITSIIVSLIRQAVLMNVETFKTD